MPSKIITAWQFASAMINAGIIEQQNMENVSRIVIDANAGDGVVKMYVEYLLDERVLSVVQTLEGIEVKHAKRTSS